MRAYSEPLNKKSKLLRRKIMFILHGRPPYYSDPVILATVTQHYHDSL